MPDPDINDPSIRGTGYLGRAHVIDGHDLRIAAGLASIGIAASPELPQASAQCQDAIFAGSRRAVNGARLSRIPPIRRV